MQWRRGLGNKILQATSKTSTIKQKKNLCCRVTMMLSGQWPSQGTCSVVCYQHLQLSSQFSCAQLIVEAPDVVISPLCPLSCLCCTLIHTDLFKIALSSSYYWAVSTTLILLRWVLPICGMCWALCWAGPTQNFIPFPASKAFSTPIWPLKNISNLSKDTLLLSGSAWVHAQSCPTLCDPMDCSLPGSSSTGFPRQGYCSGLPFPSLGLPDPEIKPTSPALAGRVFTTEPPGKPSKW